LDENRDPASARRRQLAGDTPGRIRAKRCSCRYGWSWP